jgi:hypothetical protein
VALSHPSRCHGHPWSVAVVALPHPTAVVALISCTISCAILLRAPVLRPAIFVVRAILLRARRCSVPARCRGHLTVCPCPASWPCLLPSRPSSAPVRRHSCNHLPSPACLLRAPPSAAASSICAAHNIGSVCICAECSPGQIC